MLTQNTGIKNWAEDDRPREKLLLKGRSVLSDAELMAILIRSGSSTLSAVELSKNILQSVHYNLNALGRLGVEDFLRFKGIGEAKALSIIAALELGKRRRLSDALERKKISSSNNGFEILQPLLGDLPHEEFWVIFLNTGNKVIRSQCMSKGGISGTLADVRMIYKEAVLLNASAIILAHNHPSGACNPSHADKQLTRKMIDAGKIMDIAVLDHLIITEHEYYSFADEGQL